MFKLGEGLKLLPCHDSLPVWSNVQYDFLNLGFKPHVQHSICLIKHLKIKGLELLNLGLSSASCEGI